MSMKKKENVSVVYKTPSEEKPILLRFINVGRIGFEGPFLVIYCREGEKKALRTDYILEMSITLPEVAVTAYGRTTYGPDGSELKDFKEIRYYDFSEVDYEETSPVGVNPDGSINMNSDYAKYVR